MPRAWILALFVASLCLACTATPKDSFAETLDIKPLQDGRIQMLFTFRVEAPSRAEDFRLFPKSLAQILHHFNVEEMHMTLAKGRWRHNEWGPGLVQPSPIGLELAVNFHPLHADTTPNPAYPHGTIDNQWEGLVEALSGLLCTSANYLKVPCQHSVDTQVFARGMVTTPRLSQWSLSHHPDRVGVLTSEAVCTENLTPFVLLLPNRGKSGVSAMLEGTKVFATSYHSLSVRYQYNATTQTESLQQSVSFVVKARDESQSQFYHKDWTVSDLLGKPIRKCPISTTSKVQLHLSPTFTGGQATRQWPFAISPEGYTTRTVGKDYILAYKPTFQPLDVGVAWQTKTPITPWGTKLAYPLQVHQYQTGSGSLGGRVVCSLTNSGPVPLTLTYHQLIPLSIQPNFHTLSLTASSSPRNLFSPDQLRQPNTTTQLILTPPPTYQSQASFEARFVMPPHASMAVEWTFLKKIMPLSFYPPDDQRGVAMPSPIIGVTGDHPAPYYGGGHDGGYRYSMPPLDVSFPTPDFSMPFNVITFTCTIMATLFGTMFNLLVRDRYTGSKSVEEDDTPDTTN